MLKRIDKANVNIKTTNSFATLSSYGVATGSITGFLGAGGGFLLIPALVLILRLPMKTAIGTSLLIIALNSLVGFVADAGHYEMDWGLLIGDNRNCHCWSVYRRIFKQENRWRQVEKRLRMVCSVDGCFHHYERNL